MRAKRGSMIGLRGDDKPHTVDEIAPLGADWIATYVEVIGVLHNDLLDAEELDDIWDFAETIIGEALKEMEQLKAVQARRMKRRWCHPWARHRTEKSLT